MDDDGVIWPHDTFYGFYRLGYGLLLSLLAVFIIHPNFSYPTVRTIVPDPFFRIYTRNIHKAKHGSDSGTYDTEGRFIPQRFEDLFTKYADGRDFLTFWDVTKLLKGQRCIADPIGWGGALFECECWTARPNSRVFADPTRARNLYYAVAGGREDEKRGHPRYLRRKHVLHYCGKEGTEKVFSKNLTILRAWLNR